MIAMRRLQTYWNGQAEWWRSRSLEWWAAHLTAFYVGGAIIIMGAKFDDLILLKLNEIGDFAAGVFGPVAFVWLVLGYLQQGKELRISSDALCMQADELRASVMQQTEMVKAQNSSLLHQERLLEPLLEVSFEENTTNFDEGEPISIDSFVIVNRGNYCEHVFAIVLVGGEEAVTYRLPPFNKDSSKTLNVVDRISLHDHCEIQIHYKKTSGKEGVQRFTLFKYSSPDGVGVQVIKQPLQGESFPRVGC
jgi:hypothetical protein